jgi:hypothetical protein
MDRNSPPMTTERSDLRRVAGAFHQASMFISVHLWLKVDFKTLSDGKPA